MVIGSHPVVLLDMQAADLTERRRLIDRRSAILQSVGGPGGIGDLTQEQRADYDDITKQLGLDAGGGTGTPPHPLDPVFLVLQLDFARNAQTVDDRFQGLFPSGLNPTEKAFAAVYGILERDSHTDPRNAQTFAVAISMARGEFNAYSDLYLGVLEVLLVEGQQPNGSLPPPGVDAPAVERVYPLPHSEIRADQWAAVVKALIQQGVSAGDRLLGLKTQQALAAVAGANDSAPPSAVAIDLPDLEQQADREIVAPNVQAMQAIYFAAMLEEVKIFNVTEKLVELFQLGMLPLGKGRAGDLLYGYWKQSVNRMTEVERRNLYARCFGLPGGDASSGSPNREFNDLWMRFVSATTSYVRQLTVDDMLRARTPMPVNVEQVRKAGRDLAANLSLHGYGIAYFAATELQRQLNDVISLLGDPEMKASYGARDMWQLIDQVATLELGGARNSVRYRTMATSGAIIIRWLADHADLLAQSGRAGILDISQVRNPLPRPRGTKPTTNPSDADLVDACEQWLAVTGTTETRVEQFSEPVEIPSSPTRPIQIPAVARDMLEAVGIKSNGMLQG